MSSASRNENGPPRPAPVVVAVWSGVALLVVGVLVGQLLFPGTNRPATPKRVLRIAADPNNMPFTNARREGFENKIASLLGRQLDAEIEYVWRPMRRGFFRASFKEGDCDLVMGVPAGFDQVLTTKPYYRSSYVFVSREARGLAIRSFDDPALRRLRVGVQLVGDDGVNTPPAHALSARGMVDNVFGYSVFGDYSEECPAGRIIDAVRVGEVDIAVAWGPLAGHVASRKGDPLVLTPVEACPSPACQQFAFDFCVGVRRGRKELRDEIDQALALRRDEILEILKEASVPLVPGGSPGE